MTTLTKGMLELAAACSLVALLVSPALGGETTGKAPATEPTEPWAESPARPPPFVDLPWMAADAREPPGGLFGARVDTLGPFLLQPTSPVARFSPNWTPPPFRTE